jgi:PhnB protein
MAHINPWINFNGNAEEAFEFYRSVFGGEFSKLERVEGSGKIMQIALPIGGNVLIANDVPEEMGRVSENENRSKISVSAESREEAVKVFNGLSVGGTVECPIEEGSEGACFGMFRDKFGIEWIVEFDSAA